MKLLFPIFFTCAIFSACSSDNQLSGELIVIDVSQNYPEKEIRLTDIADIEYIQLDTSDDAYLYQYGVPFFTENTTIIRSSDDILFFGKDGAPQSNFNHRGNGPGEYPARLYDIIYDEITDELYAWSHFNKIMVYSSTGDYKRTLTLPIDIMINNRLVILDTESLLLYDDSHRRDMADRLFEQAAGGAQQPTTETDSIHSPFIRISRADGSVLEYINVPQNRNIFLGAYYLLRGEIPTVPTGRTDRIVPYKDGWILFSHETDTAYFYDKNLTLKPFLVRTPSIAGQSPYVYPNPLIEAGGYQFMELVTVAPQPPRGSFPSTYLARDTQTGEIYKAKIVFEEFIGIDINLIPFILRTTHDSRVGSKVLSFNELIEAYKAGKLSGRLKEIVSTFDEDEESDIYMLMHFK